MNIDETAVSAASGATVNRDNPWPGLLAFRETDTGYFQGRQRETEDLLRLVLRERLTVLFGLSGLGKTSLLQAGVFPKLRQKNVFPVYIRLDFSSEWRNLSSQVFTTIAREASAHEIEAPPPKDAETLWEYFHRDGNNFWNARNRPVMPLLVFDQFEELFTLGRLDADRSLAAEGFLQQLADLVECRPPAKLKRRIDEHPDEAAAFNFGRHSYKLLIGIREDFLPELEALRDGMPTVALNRVRLQRMNGEAALLVVSQAQHLIDSDVAEQVVRFVAADKAGLPLASLEIEPALLSLVCSELNNRRQKRREPKISADLLRGNQEEVLADFYEQKMADFAPEVRSFVEDRLLTVSGYRDSVALENALSTPGVSREDIDKLVDRRLVRREDRGGAQRLELTHDLLAGVVRTSRDSRRQRESEEQERAVLLREQEEQKQALLKAKEDERLQLEQAQIRERTERDRRDLRRLRWFLAVIATGMSLAVLLTGYAFWQRREARAYAAAAAEQRSFAERNAAVAKEQEAIAEENANEAAVQKAIAQKNVALVTAAEKNAKNEAQLARLAEQAATENARQTQKLQYQTTLGIQQALRSTDLKEVQAILEKTLNAVEATKTGSNAAAESNEVGKQETGFMPRCAFPFKGVRNPAIDDHCGLLGGSSDPDKQAESAAKNNFCAPTSNPYVVTYEKFLMLQAQSALVPNQREDRHEARNLGEGNYVSYVALIKNAHYSDTTGGEVVNCNMSGTAPNDIAIVLMSDPNDTDECHSIRAEISPHYRPLNWAPATLNAIKKPVRIRGQLFNDNSHVPCSGNLRPNPQRASVWEIHPVYSIDVCKMNDLDQCRASNNPADWAPLE